MSVRKHANRFSLFSFYFHPLTRNIQYCHVIREISGIAITVGSLMSPAFLCLPPSLFLSLATSPSLTPHATSLKTQQNKKVLENKCFQQTSSIKAINQERLDYSSLVSCGQQHREPRRAIFIPLMKAMRNLQRLTLDGYKKRGC